MLFEKLSFLRDLNAVKKQGYCTSSNELQIILKNQYSIMKNMGCLPAIENVGFRNFSQFEEDGILLYIFSLIGEGNKMAVELCCGIGSESMTANLIINHGWDALLVDGNKRNIRRCHAFYKYHANSKFIMQPKIIQAWITKDNINTIMKENLNSTGENDVIDIDLLSLDIDGNDYHILNALNAISPRVIVCESHSFIPEDISITIPYTDSFVKKDDFYGASSKAMVNLLKKKGYRFVGAHRFGGNLFFVKNGIGEDVLPERSIHEFRKHRYFNEYASKRWDNVSKRKWIEV